MTKDEARIVLLEDALEQARNTIQFMHGCLTHPQYHYAYPEHTEQMVERINALVPERKYCIHSGLRNNEDCESCVQRVTRAILRHEAEQTLNEGDNDGRTETE